MEEQKTNSWEKWQKRTTAWVEFGSKESVRKYKIQNLTGEEYDAIQALPVPSAPERVKYGSDGKPVLVSGKPQYSPDYQDEGYLKELEHANRLRITKILEYGLVDPNGSEIPGSTVDEKWAFLKKGNIGDILKLCDRILNDLTNLKPEDVDFLNKR